MVISVQIKGAPGSHHSSMEWLSGWKTNLREEAGGQSLLVPLTHCPCTELPEETSVLTSPCRRLPALRAAWAASAPITGWPTQGSRVVQLREKEVSRYGLAQERSGEELPRE